MFRFVSTASMRTAAPLLRTGVAPLSTARLAASDMFCFQCEQTENASGCTTVGVCGKTPEVAAEQDLLVEQIVRIGANSHAIKAAGGEVPDEVNQFLLDGMFSTLTNVNFDSARFETMCEEANKLLESSSAAAEALGAKSAPAIQIAEFNGNTLPEVGKQFSVPSRMENIGNADVAAVTELTLYGIKGLMAYAEHARRLGNESQDVYSFIYKALAQIGEAQASGKAELGDMLNLALETGATNVTVMSMLDQAHRDNLGVPSPAKVSIRPKAGKAILVSGHDMIDLKNILEQTKGTGINVYTHGEMLPAHSYPALREYDHLVGQYGTAWQLQNLEFSTFPGAIVVTSNCIVEPRKRYRESIFTTNATGFPDVPHVEDGDFSAVIEKALELPGFNGTEMASFEGKELDVGFGRETVLSVAGTIKELVEAGKLSHFFLLGGCDGSEPEREQFLTQIAKETPEDSLILTLGCAKYRVNNLGLGELGDTGLPRVLDMGQCNDSYSAVAVALALKEAFGTESVNDLPLSLAVSWLEQKAAAVLLSLLHLGITNIRLGPELPAFITPNVLDVLVNDFGLKPMGDAKDTVAAMMKGE